VPAVLATFGVATALFFTGCGDDNGDDSLVAGMTLSGQVFVPSLTTVPGLSVSYAAFTGTHGIEDWPTGKAGAITSGRFDMAVGAPAFEHLFQITGIDWGFLFMFDDVITSPLTVWVTVLDLETTGGVWLRREEVSASGDPAGIISAEIDFVDYIFVDRPVTISGVGINETHDGLTLVSDNFSISLRRGWNAVRTRGQFNFNLAEETGVKRATISGGDPNLRWVLGDDTWGEIFGMEAASLDLRGRAGGTLRSPRTRR